MKPELNCSQFVIGNIRELAIYKTDQRQGYPAEQVDVSVGRKLSMVSRHTHYDSQTNPNDEIHNSDLQPYNARGIRHVASLVDEKFCSAKARPTLGRSQADARGWERWFCQEHMADGIWPMVYGFGTKTSVAS